MKKSLAFFLFLFLNLAYESDMIILGGLDMKDIEKILKMTEEELTDYFNSLTIDEVRKLIQKLNEVKKDAD